MRTPRIYHPAALRGQQQITLSDEAAHHVVRVLRMQAGQPLELFDGTNHIFAAQIQQIDKKSVQVSLNEGQLCNRESALHLHLGQVISRGEKMEFTIQKAVELGVNMFTPLLSQRCGVKLDDDRLNKKVQQWQKIAIAACEQCGRNQLPEICPVQPLSVWQQQQDEATKLILNPHNGKSLKALTIPSARIRLLIGPEGGLTEQEIAFGEQQGFINVLLGPRVLRTETAALTAISALQLCFGDLA